MSYLHESGDERYFTFGDYSTTTTKHKYEPKLPLSAIEKEKQTLHWFIQEAACSPNPVFALSKIMTDFSSQHLLPNRTLSPENYAIMDWLDKWNQEFMRIALKVDDLEAETAKDPDFLKES